MRLPDPSLQWPIDYAAVEKIARCEECRLNAYRCPAGVWTIGWGHTKNAKPGDTITESQADRLLLEDLNFFVPRVESVLTRSASRNELAAMVSLAFNIGMGDPRRKIKGFSTSTVLRKHNAGDTTAAAEAFGLWRNITVNGVRQISQGLVNRRAREAALYLTPDSDESVPPVAQSVAPEENPLAHSRTMFAGGAGLSVLGADILLPMIFGDQSNQIAQLIEYWQSGDTATRVIIGGLIAYIMWVRRDDWIKRLR